MASSLAFQAELHLYATDDGGRRTSLPHRMMLLFDLGRTWRDKPVFLDARVTLQGRGELAPGDACLVLVEPLSEDLWEGVEAGQVFTVHEGRPARGHGVITARLDPARALLQ